MKVRDSGMPNEKTWNSFFDVDLILKELFIHSQIENLVEIGCGYGTFTLPAAQQLKGKLYAFDIELDMIDCVNKKILKNQIPNIILEQRDVLKHTIGLNDSSVDYVMLFNLLHHDAPNDFFIECHRILQQKGRIGIIHWRCDIATPRGPEMSIRPTPNQIVNWIDTNQFAIEREPFIILPFHYGLVVRKR